MDGCGKQQQLHGGYGGGGVMNGSCDSTAVDCETAGTNLFCSRVTATSLKD